MPQTEEIIRVVDVVMDPLMNPNLFLIGHKVRWNLSASNPPLSRAPVRGRVCQRETGRENERERVCVCVCVWERERERGKEGGRDVGAPRMSRVQTGTR